VVLWPKIGRLGPTCQAGRAAKFPPSTTFGHWIPWPAGHVLAHLQKLSIGPVLCAMSFPRVILFVTMPYFEHNEDIHGF
jgi:hypothetical protein